ncbi:hypothetical protein D3C75_1283000 [compost metagenome]
MAVNHRAIGNCDVLAGYPFPGVFGAGLDRYTVISDINDAVTDAHTRAGFRVNAICVRRIRGI